MSTPSPFFAFRGRRAKPSRKLISRFLPSRQKGKTFAKNNRGLFALPKKSKKLHLVSQKTNRRARSLPWDLTGVHRDPTGAHWDPTGAHWDPTGAHEDPTSVHWDPSGACWRSLGSHWRPLGSTGAHWDPTGAHWDPTGVH